MTSTSLPSKDKYPKILFIRNEIYKILMNPKMKDFGETNYEKKTITLKSAMSSRELFKTFIHEMLHALDEENGIGLTHKQVYKLETAIFELLIDNFL